MCDLPGSARVVSGASALRIRTHQICPPPCGAGKSHIVTSQPPPRARGETETGSWEAWSDESGWQPESLSAESLLGPGPEPRACPYVPWQGGAVAPFFRVRLRLTRLSHLLGSHRGAGTRTQCPLTPVLSPLIWPHTAVWPLATCKNQWGQLPPRWGWGGTRLGRGCAFSELAAWGAVFPGTPPPGGSSPLPLSTKGGGTAVTVGVGRVAESKWQAVGGRIL